MAVEFFRILNRGCLGREDESKSAPETSASDLQGEMLSVDNA